jgi:hypothetical protein
MKLEKLNPLSAELFNLFICATIYNSPVPWSCQRAFIFTLCNNFHFYSPEAIGVWPFSSGKRPKEKIQLIL